MLRPLRRVMPQLSAGHRLAPLDAAKVSTNHSALPTCDESKMDVQPFEPYH